MRPPKKHLCTLMLSLCIVTSSLMPGNAAAFSQSAASSAGAIRPDHASQTAPPGHRERPRRTQAEKLAHLPVPHPLDQIAAPQPLALMPTSQVTLARGMTFRKLLRRRTLG